MKRPSFQFYPADWRNNAKLRRCSDAARGAWIDVLCVLHDSDEYGVARGGATLARLMSEAEVYAQEQLAAAGRAMRVAEAAAQPRLAVALAGLDGLGIDLTARLAPFAHWQVPDADDEADDPEHDEPHVEQPTLADPRVERALQPCRVHVVGSTVEIDDVAAHTA